MNTPLEPCNAALDRALTPKPEPSDAALRKALQASLAAQGKRSCSKCGFVGDIATAFMARKDKTSYWCRKCEREAVQQAKARKDAKTAERIEAMQKEIDTLNYVLMAIMQNPDEFAANGPALEFGNALTCGDVKRVEQWVDNKMEAAWARSQEGAR